MKIGSLFDGSGGFPLAASLCGIEPVWASEVEPYPIAVTRSRFPNMKHLGDVSKINGAKVEPVDVITFGSPCQDLSVAGKRAGLKHTENGDDETTRSGLFMEAVRIIKEMREVTHGKYPRFAVWENVPGAFSSNKGEDFRTVLEELIKIVEPTAVMPEVPKNGWAYADSFCGNGWSLSWRVLDAQYIRTAQRRRRIYLVLDLRTERAWEVSFKRESLRGYPAQSGAPWQEAAGDVGGSVAVHDRASGIMAEPVVYNGENITHPLNKTNPQPGDPCHTLGTDNRNWVVIPTVAVGIDGYNSCVTGDKAATIGVNCDRSTGRNGVCIMEQYLFENHSQDARYRGPLGVCPMLSAQMGTGGNNQPLVLCMATQQGGAEIMEDLCPTITASAGMSGNNQPVACYAMQAIGEYKDCDKASSMKARDYKDATDLVVEEQLVGCFQNTGVGWWNESDVGATLRTPCGGDSTLANVVVENQCAGVDCRNLVEHPELYPTLQAKPNGGQSLNYSGAVRVHYIVRRLTPTECARLQGFPDRWGDIDPKEDFTDEEYRFWLDVRNTHAAINGKAVKDYTPKQMLTWYNKLHTDSAEYKMWGNGIALPCALYVMQGIQDALEVAV